MRLPLQDLDVVQQHTSVAGLQPAVGRHPRIEQAGRFERGFEAGALRSGNGVAKIHQLPERRTRARGSCGGVTCRGQWRRGIDARFETVAFVVEGVALGLQGLTLPVERDAPLRQTQAGLLLRRLQAMSRRIVAIQPEHPVGQRRKRCDTVVGADVQLLDAAEVTLPGLDQLAALLLDLRIGLLAALRRRLDGILSLVAGLPALLLPGFGRRQLGVALPQHRDLFAPTEHQAAKPGAGLVESQWRQRREIGGIENRQRALAMRDGQACGFGVGGAVATQAGHVTFGLRHALRRVFGLLGAASQSPPRLVDRGGGGLARTLPRRGVFRGGVQPIGVLHRRVFTQGVEPSALTGQRQLSRVVGLLGAGFCDRGGF